MKIKSKRKQESSSRVPRIWLLFPQLAQTIKAKHLAVGLVGHGHDFDHALRVGQMAVRVTWNQSRRVAVLAGIAGLCHNADRITEKHKGLSTTSNATDASVADVTALVNGWLDLVPGLSLTERGSIIDAVIHHGSKPNGSDNPLILVGLTDADRLVNLEADIIPRTAQHHHDIPVLDPVVFENDPKANYKEPGTVFWDLNNTRSWANKGGPWSIRLPESRRLARERAKFLDDYFRLIKKQRKDSGLIPYPEI